MLLVTHPKALAEILVVRSYDFPKPDKDRAFLRRMIGDGLVTTEGTFHKHQRKHSMPSFSFRQIKRLYPLFWEKSLKMVKGIDAEVFGQSVDKHPTGVTDIEYWAPKTTLDIIGVAGLGRDFDTLKNADDEMVKHYQEITSTDLGRRMLTAVSLMLNRELADLFLPSVAKRFNEATAKMRVICRQFVREKGERISQKDDDSIDTLATLMKSQVFSEEELVDQLLTIIAAG
jgi:cytochrome P450